MVAIDGLNPHDPGITLLGAAAAKLDPQRVLLAYCGDVPMVGNAAHRLVLDVRETVGARHRCHHAALELAGDSELASGFEMALVWPRAHLGKDFSERCLAEAGLLLECGGAVLCAVRKQKGAKSLAAFMGELFGRVDVVGRQSGYQLLRGEKTAKFRVDLARERVEQRYQIDDERLPAPGLVTVPGVFSRRELDRGTACLIDHLARAADQPVPPRVLDLCAGVGPLTLWCAHRWPAARVYSVESNLLAAHLLEHNAARHGVTERVAVRLQDGLLPPPIEERSMIDLAVCNPPTHAEPEALATLLGNFRMWLRPDGTAHVVVNRPGRTLSALHEAGAATSVAEYAGYVVITGRWPA